MCLTKSFEFTAKLRTRRQASSPGIRADVTVVLEVRQSIERTVARLHLPFYRKISLNGNIVIAILLFPAMHGLLL